MIEPRRSALVEPDQPISATLHAALIAVCMLVTALPLAARTTVQVPVLPGLSDTHEANNEDINPEAATGRAEHDLAHASRYMVSAANPIAAQAGADILAEGGSAVDAAIAMQMVLNLVEPQSSGIGGGGFALTYDAVSGHVQAWDGRETAPVTADPTRFMKDGQPLSFSDAVNNGLSVGTPGLLRMLGMLHQQQGRLPWAELFQPAIRLAENGFPVSRRLHGLLSDNRALRDQPAAASYFYNSSGQPWPVGHVLKNPALADVFTDIAVQGPDAFYQGPLAQRIVDAVQSHSVPGDLGLDDLAQYQARQRDPLCMPYKVYVLCSMPPPSSGGIAVMQMLGLLSHTPIASQEPDSLMSVHYFSEAGRLAYADRDRYVADPDFVDVPVQGMLDSGYLKQRAALIDSRQSMGVARAGQPPGTEARPGRGNTPEQPSTTHMVAADASGNVISMTTTIESAFGSKLLVDGFLLNNELTDFSLRDVDDEGRPVVNRVQPLKRPRSSMAPIIVLRDGKPYMALGSPGGSAIINYVAKTLLGTLDWGLDIQQAINLPNRGSRNRYTELEAGTSLTSLADDLKRMGHDVREMDFPSGLQGMMFTESGKLGGSDPRREGRALGR